MKQFQFKSKRTLNPLSVQLLCAALLTVAVLCETSWAQEGNQARGDYQIGPGDELEIIIWRNTELSRTVTVRPDGWISLPLVNDVRAAGFTPMQLRDALSKNLEEFISAPSVSVIVTQVRSFKVSILGKVMSPGRYELHGPTTVLDLLALAGGFQEFSSPNEIYILRPAEEAYERITFKYSVATSAGGRVDNVQLKPGDFVIVP
jgi:polysaccharide export outer membrane protein